MDINMKNVELKRENENSNWICIYEKDTDKYTKLLYDDGKYSDPTQLDLLRERIAKYNEFK